MEKRGPYTKYLRGCIRDSEETRDTCGISLRIASNPNVGGMRRCLGPTVCGTSGRRRSSFRGDVSATSWPTWIPSKGYERLVSSYRAQRGRSLYCYVYRCDVSLLSGAAEKGGQPQRGRQSEGGLPDRPIFTLCECVRGGNHVRRLVSRCPVVSLPRRCAPSRAMCRKIVLIHAFKNLCMHSFIYPLHAVEVE